MFAYIYCTKVIKVKENARNLGESFLLEGLSVHMSQNNTLAMFPPEKETDILLVFKGLHLIER